MSVDFVVGEVGFGPSFATNPADNQVIAELEARIDELTWQLHETRRVLQKCAALSPQISDEKHEILLATAPKNH